MIQQHHFLFFTQKTIRYLLFIVLMSQLSTIAVAALDFSTHEAYVLSQESEEPKPKEGKNASDFLDTPDGTISVKGDNRDTSYFRISR